MFGSLMTKHKYYLDHLNRELLTPLFIAKAETSVCIYCRLSILLFMRADIVPACRQFINIERVFFYSEYTCNSKNANS